ncbi:MULTISPECIES: hypothetical protein [unclassified Okeania]|uniref:hypothetical protein n=1 Tax=unclassified Okeania TaxID=2634635 RepID=UPI0013C110E3|nr:MULTISPECIES: hypothetical protein [unclassified Okeania]NET44661.1 hypothetical protein [Okeania sp. SIO2B3]GGA45947.1 hypothetical protein CYANOKiyG1_64910 [Okeania sp. KiyG1]
MANLTGSDLINLGSELNQSTTQAWGELWGEAISSSSPLWQALNDLGLLLAGISLLYLAIEKIQPLLEKQSWSALADLLIMPLIVVCLLGGNGTLAAGVVQTFYGIGSYNVQFVLTQQIGSSSLDAQTALNEIRQENAEQAIEQEIYADCMNLPPAEQQQCMEDPAREEAANEAGVDVPSPTVSGGNPLTNGLRSALITLLMMFLYAIQWAFINCMEAALLMTALLFPPALGISILPVAGKTVFAWASAMVGMFATMLSYNIIVGLTAIVVKKAQVAAGQDMGGTSFRDIAFAAFIAVASPVLAIYLGQMGGVALFQAISKQAAAVVSGVGSFAMGAGVATTRVVAQSGAGRAFARRIRQAFQK